MLFPKWTNKIPLILLVGAAVTLVAVTFVFWYWFSPRHLEVGYQPEQPIAYSHRLHAGELGMDCRYCHTGVETSPVAGVPPTETCMNCHTQIQKDAPEIVKLRDYHFSGNPVPWVRVHKLPDYAYFDHSAHVNKGVSCVSCHGRVDMMEKVRQVEPLSMVWCLDCHRNPAPNIREKKLVTKLDWQPEGDPLTYGKQFVELYNIYTRVDCSTCHR